MKTTHTFIYHSKLLSLILLASGIFSVYLGKELCWDLANYHYYLPFAWLNHRSQMDFWPNSYLQQFINPTIDLLPYLLITYFSPWQTEFILGAIHGANLWLLFLIATHFLQDKPDDELAFLLALLGMIGPTVLPGIGSMQNDNFVSLFVLGFIVLQLKAFPKASAISGFILGLGLGLKLTVGTYVVGAGLAFLLLPIPFKERIQFTALLAMTVILGMAITAGDWMFLLWQKHHNPFFPFLNNLFRSPDFSATNWRDERFLPRSFWETVFFPFYFSWNGRTADIPFRDFRFPVVYVLFVIAGISWLSKKLRQMICKFQDHFLQYDNALAISHYWLFAFFIGSYVIWEYYFSIARYLGVLEMLCPLVIYLLVTQLIAQLALRFTVLMTVFSALIFFFTPIPMVRLNGYGKSFFNVSLPASISYFPKATVLIAYPAFVMESDPRPQSYLVPFFPKTWRFIGVPFRHEHYLSDNAVTQQILRALKDQEGPVFLLTSGKDMPALLQTVSQWGYRANGACENIYSDRQWISRQNVLLCPVMKRYETLSVSISPRLHTGQVSS